MNNTDFFCQEKFAPERVLDFSNSVFLAGSIEMGTAENWHEKITLFLKDNRDTFQPVTILNPRRPDWDNTWEQKLTNPKFYEQVNWELNCLEKCRVIALYFDPKTKSPISLLELGLFIGMNKDIIVCCPDGFWRQGNVEITCQRYGIPFHRSFDTWALNVKQKLGL